MHQDLAAHKETQEPKQLTAPVLFEGVKPHQPLNQLQNSRSKQIYIIVTTI